MQTAHKAKETQGIADQLRLLYQGPSWLGPSVKEILVDIDEEVAQSRPIADAHTIWELVLHMAAWLRISRERLSAVSNRDVNEKENWPSMEGTWQRAISSLEAETFALEQAILEFPAQRLLERAPASEPQTFYTLLHGVIQHSAYHAGQIALLKKAKRRI
jgi:uncharacterized damage-inducible protein DinB